MKTQTHLESFVTFFILSGLLFASLSFAGGEEDINDVLPIARHSVSGGSSGYMSPAAERKARAYSITANTAYLTTETGNVVDLRQHFSSSGTVGNNPSPGEPRSSSSVNLFNAIESTRSH